ncbi:MAG TPA: cupin domain-containing protein [Thermoanaerobaculia bacterium]|jgi:putative transcriptional regulator|nr:cupin domain-containing protein [Thermoanaerobaculia bacterium]
MHPTEELLLAVASGQADLPHRVLVEGHLDGCAACRVTVGEITAPGGALLASLPEAPVPDHLWESLRLRIETSEPTGPSLSPALAGAPLPESARRELPEAWKSREIRWHRLPARGARFATLLRDPFTGSCLYLGHMPPGRFAPEHVHLGPEDLLILAGGYEDQFGVFEAGAYASYAPGSRHRPLTEPDEECWILFRLERPNLLTGWRGWLQRLVT